MTAPLQPKPRIIFIANCVYGPHVGGGDIHFFNMARAALAAGYDLVFIGGHALEHHLRAQNIPAEVWLTDREMLRPFDASTLRGQLKLFLDYLGRYLRTQAMVSRITPHDLVYAATDYWFDALPMMRAPAHRKLMILGMTAPTWRQILTAGRPDVTPLRLPSLYYRISQSLSLRLFRKHPAKRLFYVHPEMLAPLLRLGYREDELVFISNGMDLRTIETVPDQAKQYDVIWMGRYHRQKGIEDLIETISHLSRQFPDLKVVLIGKLRAQLEPGLAARGLMKHVEFTGFVTEVEKFRILKSGRVFLMPSHYESWGIVIAEAIACGATVVAYQLDAYEPIFGAIPLYVKPFDLQSFAETAATALQEARNRNGSEPTPAARIFCETNSWEAVGRTFTSTVAALADRSV